MQNDLVNTLLGISFILMGGIAAASFYTPFKKVQNWSWETFWLVHAFMAYLISPWFFALISVPWGEIPNIIDSTSSRIIWLVFLFGIMWGIGGFCYGLAIRYLGIGLGQSAVLGFTAAFGTLIPPLVAGENLFVSRSGILTIIGVSVCILGITIVGYAGHLKEKQLNVDERIRQVAKFVYRKGLLIAIFAGVMSAAMNYGFLAGKPMSEITRLHGTNVLFTNCLVLVFILFGGFISTAIFCLYLNIKNNSIYEYFRIERKIIKRNFFLCFIAGFLWSLEFQFYGMGIGKLPVTLSVLGWSILMAGEISASNVWGFLMKEWKGVQTNTLQIFFAGIFILIFSVFIVLI